MKKHYRFLSFSCTLGILMLLAGCAHYKAKPLRHLEHNSKTKGVSLEYYVFSKADCKEYLDRDVLKEGYQPLQLSIVNNTDNTYAITPDCLSLPTAPESYVASRVHTSTTGRAVGYGAAAVVSCGLFAIPAIIDGIGSSEANKQLDSDFSSKTIHLNGKHIKPHSMLNGLVFIPKEDFDEDFTITLYDKATKQKLVLNSI